MKEDTFAERIAMTVSESLLFEEKNGYPWITLPGLLKRENLLQTQNRIETSLQGKKAFVALDFKNISNLYSITINLIMRLREFVQAHGGDIFVVNLSDRCLRQLQLMHLEKVLTIYRKEVDLPPQMSK